MDADVNSRKIYIEQGIAHRRFGSPFETARGSVLTLNPLNFGLAGAR